MTSSDRHVRRQLSLLCLMSPFAVLEYACVNTRATGVSKRHDTQLSFRSQRSSENYKNSTWPTCSSSSVLSVPPKQQYSHFPSSHHLPADNHHHHRTHLTTWKHEFLDVLPKSSHPSDDVPKCSHCLRHVYLSVPLTQSENS